MKEPTHTKKTSFLTSLFSLYFCYSCVVPKIELTKEEKKIENKLKRDLNCNDVEFRHDYNAIKEGRKDGIFMITICSNYCHLDSIHLTPISINIAHSIKPILSHSSNYSTIMLYASTEKQLDDKTSKLICNKTVRIALEDLRVIEFSN